MTNSSNTDVCARVYIVASTGASIRITTDPLIPTVPSTAPSNLPSKPPEGVCMIGTDSTRGGSMIGLTISNDITTIQSERAENVAQDMSTLEWSVPDQKQ